MRTSNFVSVFASMTLIGASSAMAALDNYDGYAANTDLLGSGNGQVSYVLPATGGGGSGTGLIVRAVAEGTASSSPNVLLLDPTGVGSVGFVLAPGQIIDMTTVGTQARIAFDFKTVGGRIDLGFLPAFGLADGTSKYVLDNISKAGISQNGIYWVNNGNLHSASDGNDLRYEDGVWYHWEMIITRAASSFDYSVDLRQRSDNVSLGVLNITGGAIDRQYLAEMATWGSASAGAIHIDNFTMELVPEPASLSMLSLGALALRRRK